MNIGLLNDPFTMLHFWAVENNIQKKTILLQNCFIVLFSIFYVGGVKVISLLC